MDFDEHVTNLIEICLSERTQSCPKGVKSDRITLKRGVLYGTILRSLLFNIYVSYLAKIVEKDWAVVQYADDTFFYIQH